MSQLAVVENNHHSQKGDNGSLEQNLSVQSNPVVNQTDIMSQIQQQNLLTVVHQQFNQNQGKYIDLLSKIVDYQGVLVEKHQDSPMQVKAMQNFEQFLQLMQRNQMNYNMNHEFYLENQLNLIRGNELPADALNKLKEIYLEKEISPLISENQAVLPTSAKLEEQNAIKSPASQLIGSTPTVTEELPESHSLSNKLNDTPLSKEANGHISTTQIVETVASSYTPVSTPPTHPIVQQIVISSETIALLQEKTSTTSILTAPSPEEEKASAASIATAPAPEEEKASATSILTAPAHDEEITPSSSADLTGFSNRLLEVVSDKTGYPIEMLDINMDLEADLGIDSIKQLEIFATMHEEYPELDIDPEAFRDLRTLAKIVDYLKEFLPKNQATKPLNNDNLDQEAGIERQVVKKKS